MTRTCPLSYFRPFKTVYLQKTVLRFYSIHKWTLTKIQSALQSLMEEHAHIEKYLQNAA